MAAYTKGVKRVGCRAAEGRSVAQKARSWRRLTKGGLAPHVRQTLNIQSEPFTHRYMYLIWEIVPRVTSILTWQVNISILRA